MRKKIAFYPGLSNYTCYNLQDADFKELVMVMRELKIPYPDDLLMSLKETPDDFEELARTLLAVKLYELGKVSTGMAAKLAGMSRVSFFFTMSQYGYSPIGVNPHELSQDMQNA